MPLDPHALGDAVALLTLAVDGDPEASRALIGRVLAERDPNEVVVALVALGSVLTFAVARQGAVVFNAVGCGPMRRRPVRPTGRA